jgi:hypothetical protein
MFKGKEIKRLMLIGALCCILMIASISAYLVVSSRQHIKSQADKMSASLAGTIARNLDTSFNNITEFIKATPAVPMSLDVWQILSDTKRVVSFFTGCAWAVYNCDYGVELDGSNIYAGFAKEGLSLDDLPLEVIEGMDSSMDESTLKIVDSLPGREGTFIIVTRVLNVPTLGKNMTLALVINATDQVNALSETYNADKQSMVGKQVLFSVVIFLGLLILSIIIIYFAIRRSLSDPIDAINADARRIVSGEKSASIEPSEKSIFYNLQMLLRSGQVIFQKSQQLDDEGGEQ